MKKLMLVAVLLFTAAQSTQAQRFNEERVDPSERAEKRAQNMKEHLDLSEEQYNQVLALNVKEAEMRKEQREVRKQEMEARREEMKEKRTAHNESLKEILSQEQYIKLLETKQEMQPRQKRKHGQRRHRRGKH